MEEIPLDMKQLFFNNLQLLGFDVAAMEATNHIPFNKNMFDLPNKRGAEIVLHFLFEKLNPTMCREAFRDVWPILEKKREAAFRKTCANWLSNISQEDPDSHLPRINASLFMSPGGDKFYQLLFYFSGYVLQKILESDLGSKSSDRLKYPSLSSQNIHHADVMIKAFMCSTVRHRKKYFDITQLTLKAGKAWKEAADDHVKDHRKQSKEIRELEYEIREEDQKALENSLMRGSPTKKHGRLDNLDPNFDPRTIKRAQRVQYVRDMWKQLDDFERTEAAEREIIESIVERTINKYKIDAADIHVKVPDMLLRECGEEIRRRNVSNTYQGGRLNLESVLQLWNLCLNLYLEKFKEVGMPKFDDDVKKLTSQVHVQQNYLQNAKTLRNQMSEKVPVLKESIEKLRERLDTVMFKDESPNSIRTTSLGIGLVEPSPELRFSPGSAVTPAQPLEVPRNILFLDTPTAADKLMEQMRASVKPKQLFTIDIDLLAEQGKRDSALPRPGSSKGPSQPNSRQSSRPTSARSTASSKGSRKVSQSTEKSNHKPTTPRDRDIVFPKVSSPKTMVESVGQLEGEKLDISVESIPHSARSNDSLHRTLSARSDKSSSSSSTAKASQSPRSIKSHSSERLSGRSHDSELAVPAHHQGRKTPADLLVDEIMGEGKIISPLNSGMEAFESRHLIRRTPDLEEEEENKENIEPDEVMAQQFNTNSNNINSIVNDKDADVEDTMITLTGKDFDAEFTDHKKIYNDPTGDDEDIDLDKIEFEEIMGPELDDEYVNDDSEGSHRSVERVIVIDRSLHLSPKNTQTDITDLHVDVDVYNLDDERSQSTGTSPREPIVIDHSFQRSPISKDQGNFNCMNNSPDHLSRSLQARTVDRDQVRKDVLSKSLILERSPLSDEIRQMFQKAAAETPPRPQSSSIIFRNQNRIQMSGPEYEERIGSAGSEDELDLPNMDINSRQKLSHAIKKADISWEGAENLDDIEMPNFDDADECLKGDQDFEQVDNYCEKVNLNKEHSPEINSDFRIPDVCEIDDIDDFFKSKTPELPSRMQGKLNQSSNEENKSLVNTERSSFEIPKFPEKSLEEDDHSQLISFTP